MPPPTHDGREPGQPVKPSAIRYLSEFAVADTPDASGPEDADNGGDYLQAQQRQYPRQRQPARDLLWVPHQPPPEGGMPSALGRGIGGGSGPADEAERRETRYVSRCSVGGVEERGTEGEPRRQNENVDAGEGQMEMYAEGKAADAVRRNAGTRARAGRGNMSVGGPDVESTDGRGSLPGLHGRGRGEVTLEAGEADRERKKQQQAAARKQVMDARKREEVVDGRGTTGSGGR
ncbi:hypothetical protein VTH06DRAFT_4753 [Thermothelomyces fergusii]